MKRKIFSILLAIVMVLSLASVVLAAGGPTYDKPNKGGRSNQDTLWLVEKDANWDIVTRDQGGAFGKVKYNKSGSTLDMHILAHGLNPNDVYQIEIEIDGSTIYVIAAGVPSDTYGDIDFHISLSQFAEAPEAVVPAFWYDAPTAFTAGTTYSFKVWVKDDDLPANPDGSNYQYLLWEFLPGSFTAQ